MEQDDRGEFVSRVDLSALGNAHGMAVVEYIDATTVAVIAASDSSGFSPGTQFDVDNLGAMSLLPLNGASATGAALAILLSDGGAQPADLASVALVIDDELANREYYAAAFDQIGWRAESAGSGSAGIIAFAAAEPAVALVDVRLPDMNGYDVCRQLRTIDRRQCLVVLMSADPTMVEPQRAANAGADLALVGPIGVGQLRTIAEQRPPSTVRVRSSAIERPASSGVRLRLFGEPEIVLGDRWCALPAGAATDIISVMAIHHPSVLTTADLGDLAWSPPATSASPVHTALSRLRTTLTKHGCPELVVTSQQGYRLDVQAANIDTVAFEKAASDLDPSRLTDGDYVSSAQAILKAISDTAFGASSVPAVEAARVRIWEARAVLEERMSVRQILLDDTVEAVATARRLTARELWRESAWTILVAALYHSGRQREALETFQVARNLLVNSVGVDPSPALRDIEQRVLNQDPSLQDPAFIRGLAR
ncbi:MAG TPA: BTAD domain-containing putative transcriptional regulator [Ilumatobacter sp.]|nr:BTAD domain-containing putative transcriptional regulator [Ilumatobacter sp.]